MLNGAQMHEINKFIGTATTVVVVGAVIYFHYKEEKLAREIKKGRDRMKLVDAALDIRDRQKFYKIVQDGYTSPN